jgi:hypothetical protein
MNVFPSMNKTEILQMEWETFNYWVRRAVEIFNATCQRNIKYIPELIESKVDDETFERQTKRLIEKIEKMRSSKEGRING